MRGLLSLLLALSLLAGCAPESVDSYHTAENEEEIVRLLNAREYGKAIWLIESRHGRQPGEADTSFLLAQAYLGKAGFEPLKVAARVSAPQNFSSPAGKLLFPSCQSGRVEAVAQEPVLCLLKRIYLNTPDPDVEEMSRARALLRRAYPDPASAPEWVNVLIGAVETASCVKRVGAIYLRVLEARERGFRSSGEDDATFIVRQARRALDEGAQALGRADHSGNRITQLLTGNRHATWFSNARGVIQWADQAGFVPIFDLLRGFLDEGDQLRYSGFLDRIRAELEAQEKTLR